MLKNQVRDWASLADEFADLVLVEKLCDAALGEHFGVSYMTARTVRMRLGLPMNPKQRDHRRQPKAEVCLPFTTYEEDGQVIKRFPPGNALNAFTTIYTARTRK